MSYKSSKNKILIATTVGMVVVAVALVLIIIRINKGGDDKPQSFDHEKSDIITELINTENINNEKNITSDPVESSSDKGNEIKDTEKAATERKDSDIPENEKSIQVMLGDYKGIVSEYQSEIISDEAVENQLKTLQSSNTEIVNLPNRAFEKGDMAIVSFMGKLDDTRIDELTGVCLQVVIGSGTMYEKIEDEIIGKKVGDMFHVDIDYPEEYTMIPAVSGKTVDFAIELVDGFMFEVPEISDEFIRKVSEYKTVEEYKIKEKERLQKEADDKAYENMLKDLKRKVVEVCSFSGPIDSEINKQYIMKLKSENDTYMEQYYMDAPTYYSIMYGMTQEEYQKSLMDEIELQIKYDYILTEIAKQEGISKEEAEKLVISSAVIEKGER